MSRHFAHFRIALACATALAVCGCKNSAEILQDQNDGGWFSKPAAIFAKPDWARPVTSGVNLGPQGPVGAEDMVSADGRCAVPAAATAQAAEPSPATTEPAPPADHAVGTVAGSQTPAAIPAATTPNSGLQRLEPAAGPPPVAGGIALGMTECQAVQRAGTPNNVAISADEGRAQGCDHLSERTVAWYLHFCRRPSERRGARAGAAETGRTEKDSQEENAAKDRQPGI